MSKTPDFIADRRALLNHLDRFRLKSQRRFRSQAPIQVGSQLVPVYAKEWWTSRQRQALSLHEVSYRACFKPQLPGFFISLLTREGDSVYDPFSGRGTTALEAALQGRQVVANDINPLSRILAEGRLEVPSLRAIDERLEVIPLYNHLEAGMDLSMFYHPDTLAWLLSVRLWLTQRHSGGEEDDVDRWLRMIVTNRLSGHSAGFFSVYTLPPNQAVSPDRQIRLNDKRNQVPLFKDCCGIVLKKSRALQRGLTDELRQRLQQAARSAQFVNEDARKTPAIADNSVQLTVTSPPFLDIVQYAQDNWLRCWFNGIDAQAVGQRITMASRLDQWQQIMGGVFDELFRVTAPGGFVAFEVGEVRNGKIKLDEAVLPLGTRAGFEPVAILINQQDFTKTANIWGVRNNTVGTNTNRIVLFQKPIA